MIIITSFAFSPHFWAASAPALAPAPALALPLAQA